MGKRKAKEKHLVGKSGIAKTTADSASKIQIIPAELAVEPPAQKYQPTAVEGEENQQENKTTFPVKLNVNMQV